MCTKEAIRLGDVGEEIGSLLDRSNPHRVESMVSFVGLWVFLSRYPGYLRDYRAGVFTNLLVGAIIFTVIGLRMMKEGKEV